MSAHDLEPAAPAAPPAPDWSLNPKRPMWARGRDGTNATAPDVALTEESNPYNLASSLWTRDVIARGFQRARSLSWRTEVLDVPEDGAEYIARHPGAVEALYGDGDHAVQLRISDGTASLRVAARDDRLVDELVERFRRELPVSDLDPEDPRVSVTFWNLGMMGPNSRSRMIAVPAWATIDANYSDDVGGELEFVMTEDFHPGAGGQLLLWHGPPGTGKTWALRALAWEWRAWADMHYITDPEVFFGDRGAGYMLDVLLSDNDSMAQPVRIDPGTGMELDAPVPAVDPRAVDGRWKLLVLEDTGELMSSDARERAGQGLSRLLNVVDGLIGQGLKVLVLVTTNEELRTLHPAVQRPGRCASKVLFSAFDPADARRWLMDRGMTEEDAFELGVGARTVADLFAVLDARETSSDRGRAAIGFTS